MRSVMPFDMRELGPTEPVDGVYRSTRRAWFKTAGELPDDPALHTCVLAFASDMGVVAAARVPVAREEEWQRFMGASLDHAVWFHRPLRADRWILFDLRTVSSSGARGLAAGTMHSQDGVLGVSVAQEALIRPLAVERPPGA
jgi:acyl-CoA thioesterase-2